MIFDLLYRMENLVPLAFCSLGFSCLLSITVYLLLAPHLVGRTGKPIPHTLHFRATYHPLST